MKRVLLLIVFLPLIVKAQTITTYAGNGAIGYYSGDGSPATNAGLASPISVNFDINGDLLICDENLVKKVNTLTGIIYTIAGDTATTVIGNGGAATSAFIYPSGICIDATGNLYIGDGAHYEIREVNIATGIITAYAGTGSGGYSGDNGPATAAAFSGGGIGCIDTVRKFMYIPDEFNYRVRRIDMVTGIITTVAGTGTSGYSGDGIPATNAELSRPTSVCTDYSGNFYIGDWENARIRKVDIMTGIITTVVGNGTSGYSGDGGPATNAMIRETRGICFDKCGNLYFSSGNPDSNDNVIRKVDVATGVITTIAGNGTAGFSGDGGSATNAELNSPIGICIDSSGNLFIADFHNERVRKVAFGEMTCSSGTTAVEKINSSILSIYPNPTNDLLHIDGVTTQTHYRILNTIGSSLLQNNLQPGSNTISIHTLPPGIYILEFTGTDGTRVLKKIVKE